MEKSLYERLGGYDAIRAVCDDLMVRVASDAQLGRFYAHRGDDGRTREKQLLIDFICACAGGPVYYRGRDMKLTHVGMGLSDSDWEILIDHVNTTLEKFDVPEKETKDVLGFVESTRADMVEVHDLVEA